MFLKREANRGALKSWFCSYLKILLLPLLIASAMFLYSYYIIWKETNETNLAAFQIATVSLESYMRRMDSIEIRIINNDDYAVIDQMQQPLSAEDIFYLSKCSRKFPLNTSEFDIISEYCIYFSNNEIGLLNAAFLNSSHAYERYGSKFGFTSEEWEQILNEKQSGRFLVDQGKKNVLYIRSLPQKNSMGRIQIILELNTWYINQIIESMEGLGNSGFAIVDSSGTAIVDRCMDNISTLDTLTILDDFTTIEYDRKYHQITINGRKYMAAINPSTYYDLKYISFIPYNEFWKNAIKSLWYFLAAIILCILIGGTVAYLSAIQKDRVYGGILGLIKKKNPDEMLDKHQSIMVAVNNIIQEYEDMQIKIKNEEALRFKRILSDILEGKISVTGAEEFCDISRIDLPKGKFVLLLFGFREYESQFYHNQNLLQKNKIGLIEDHMSSTVREFTDYGYSSTILDVNGRVVCIIDFMNATEQACDDMIQTFLEKKRTEATTEEMALINTSISNVHEHIEEIRDAYKEVLAIQKEQNLFLTDNLMSYQEFINIPDTNYPYSMENEKILKNQLQNGNQKEAVHIIEQLFDEYVRNSKASVELLRCLIYDLVATLWKSDNIAIKEMASDSKDTIFTKIQEMNSLEGIKKDIIKKAEEICVRKNGMRKKNDLVEEINSYISKHYMDQQFSNQSIASHFNMNTTYISSYYKEKTGNNLLTYVHQVRMTHAKELLKNTGLTVEEISRDVGCCNSVSLIRLFNKYEGITPKAYRDQVRHKKE